MPRGRLRVYVGVAPGVGATYAMLAEAARRRARGADVVIGVADTHGRAPLEALMVGSERREPGALDVPALLERRPRIVAVDNLGAIDATTGRARWESVEQLIEAGINVLATTEVRAVASLAEVVAAVTQGPPPPPVPDRILLGADQVELIDMAPEALRRRLAHGGLRSAGQVDATTASLYSVETLSRLRELGFSWMTGLLAAARPESADPGEVGERILVAVPSGPDAVPLLHRAARLANRAPASELAAVHVVSGRSLPGSADLDLVALRRVAESVGARFHHVVGEDVPQALAEVAMAEHATALVVGGGAPAEGLRRVWGGRHTGALALRVLDQALGVDVHVVPTASTRSHTRSKPERIPRSRVRVASGTALAVVLPAGLTPLLLMAGDRVGLAGHSLAYLLTVVVVALVGGLWPALVCAVAASTLLNYYFIPPTHTFQVADLHNTVTLVGFLVVAGLVGAIVHRAATMTLAAARASARARTLAAVAEGTIRGEEALPALLEQLRSSFGMTSVSLLAGSDDSHDQSDEPWSVLRSVGPDAPTDPRQSDVQVSAGPGLTLALAGRALVAEERATLRAFAAQVRVVHERDQLSREAAVAERLEATGRLRDALLAAVGHDLRTPLAAATAAVTSLRSADVAWSPSERDELLATAEESLHRLTALVADLLDLSRLRSGTLTVRAETVWLDDVLGPALDELGVVPGGVQIDIPEGLPPVVADAALLTRALVNVLANALRHSPAGERVIITASPSLGRVEIRVVDRGPGIPAADHARVFQPFQRLGDSDNRTGLGLGLALSRGLVEAMSGALTPEDTPGGGLTMVIGLPEGVTA